MWKSHMSTFLVLPSRSPSPALRNPHFKPGKACHSLQGLEVRLAQGLS